MNKLLAPFLENIQKKLGADSILDIIKIQSLWSDYGGIYRLKLACSEMQSVVAKCILLEEKENHPRGWAGNQSHNRKLKSYEIENNWYKQFAATLPKNVKVPQLLYNEHRAPVQVLVLEDLSVDYPTLKSACTFTEAKTVLRWLAQFHAHFISNNADGLWPVGSYWHLGTRPEEWLAMADSPLKQRAQEIDSALNNAKFQTIIHGDAKVANFCFGENERVAAVDFQYVGKGVGVKDVAYFLGSCFTDTECKLYETDLLNFYFEELGQAPSLHNNKSAQIEKEWRALYPVAWADFNRFLLGWLPSHQKLHGHALSKNKEAFANLDNYLKN